MEKDFKITEFENSINDSSTFINPNGVLCRTIWMFGKPKYTMLNVYIRYHGMNQTDYQINREDNYWWESQPLQIQRNNGKRA